MIIDFHAHYPNEPDFADKLVALLPAAGIDRICLCSAGAAFGHADNATVLAAARQAGIAIPTICDHKDLNPYGACRMCIVEIEGVRGFPTSCTTPARWATWARSCSVAAVTKAVSRWPSVSTTRWVFDPLRRLAPS